METKILILTPIFPYPPNDGSRIRMYQMLQCLSEKYSLDLVSFYTHQDVLDTGIQELKKYCNKIFVFSLPQTNKLFSIYSADQQIKKKIMSIIMENDYSVIQVEKVIMSSYLDFKNLKGKVLIMDSWGVDSDLTKQQYIYAKNIFYKVINFVRYVRHKYKELKLLKKFNILIAITDAQRDFYRKYIKTAKIVEIQVGVDKKNFIIQPKNKEDDRTLLFLGIMNYYPNIDAVKYFCEQIFPIIKQYKQGVRFYIVGKNPTDEVLQFHNGEDIIVTGYVDDIKEYLTKATVVVIPIRMGSGLRIKIIESMAAGKAIVATKEAVEGIKAENKKHLIIASSAEEFAGWVVKLLDDKNLRDKLGVSARKFVEENFAEEIVKNKWQKLYEEVFNSYNFKK